MSLIGKFFSFLFAEELLKINILPLLKLKNFFLEINLGDCFTYFRVFLLNFGKFLVKMVVLAVSQLQAFFGGMKANFTRRYLLWLSTSADFDSPPLPKSYAVNLPKIFCEAPKRSSVALRG